MCILELISTVFPLEQCYTHVVKIQEKKYTYILPYCGEIKFLLEKYHKMKLMSNSNYHRIE